MDYGEAFEALGEFVGGDLASTLSQFEHSLRRTSVDDLPDVLADWGVSDRLLENAGHVKRLAGQVNVAIHALGIALCLPHILGPGESVVDVSLGAGNAGRAFDLETNLRVAEFKFITWRGADAVRQNSLFKDFYKLAEYERDKSKHLYVLGTEYPLRFLEGGRSVSTVINNAKMLAEFRRKYPECTRVRDYYCLNSMRVSVEDVTPLVPGLVERATDF